MRAFIFVLLFHLGIVAAAQERCATTDYLATQPAIKPAPTEQAALGTAKGGFDERPTFINKESAIIKIPVVVHVVYNNAGQNLSDAQVRSQIDALNYNFRRNNNDTVNTPARFKALAADVEIEFYLATVDAKGKATSGIVHKQSNIGVWLNNDRVKSSAQGGDDAWDSKSYLNIWTCNLASGLGYSSVPGGDPLRDGVVINFNAFGTINTPGPYNLGRSCVHEVGHWLGLRHIWGDAPCGDDGIGDTPPQGWYTQGCPTDFKSTCNNGETGDMYMNFMDYTYDACVNLFTAGQKSKMRSLFIEGGARVSFLTSKGLSEPWVESAVAITTSNNTIYPNPATLEITLKVAGLPAGSRVYIINSNGAVVGNVTMISNPQKISVVNLKPGLYFIKGDGLLERFIKL